jgi:hypothetical protein
VKGRAEENLRSNRINLINLRRDGEVLAACESSGIIILEILLLCLCILTFTTAQR